LPRTKQKYLKSVTIFGRLRPAGMENILGLASCRFVIPAAGFLLTFAPVGKSKSAKLLKEAAKL